MRPIRATLLFALLLALTSAAVANTKWYVNGVKGNDSNNCKSARTACKTIGHAISLAASGDSISVAAATYGENLTIGISLKIIGARATTTIIDGGFRGTVVTITSDSTQVTLSQLTIREGFSATAGAGIYNLATLTITDSTITDNSVTNSCRTHCRLSSGGIFNAGVLTISNSTISGNLVEGRNCYGGLSACGADGGGIGNDGTLTISNSTIVGNNAFGGLGYGTGGGISGGTIVMSSTTVSGNGVSGALKADGGGIYAGSAATLQNNIVANNGGDNKAGNCYGTITSTGYNLSSDDTCNFNNSGDLNNTDPRLGSLQNNGGQTQTESLLAGSPAIDAGNPNGCTNGQGHLLKTDQRGQPRPDKEDAGGCDMGAYESQSD